MSVVLFQNIEVTKTLTNSPQRTKKTTTFKWKFTFRNLSFSGTLSNENINFTRKEQIDLFQEMINTMKCIEEGRIKGLKSLEKEEGRRFLEYNG
ncbi:MAG: hypothetical protein E3J83_03345 [Candidatus Atribacteria bacterium]|nr:MAG: hypothetical protein E3J83_03345 [Candidatus Atribacteria bacterium]